MAESNANDADEFIRKSQFVQASRAFTAAADIRPDNAEYAFNAAMALARAPQVPPTELRGLLDRTLAANPMSPRYYRIRAEFRLQLSPPDARAVRDDFEHALQIDPNSVDMRLEYADALANLHEPAEAVRQYERALWFNDQLSPDEPKRLSEKRLADIHDKIARLRQ